MNLKKLIHGLDIIEITGNLDINIDNIANDSRKVSNNSIFIAITGFQFDGHDYIQQAIKKGAKAVIVEKNVITEENITIIKVENTRKALANISNIYYNNPSKEFNLIGVTGTNGKTSTTYFINSILEKVGHKVGIIGTLGSKVNNEISKTSNTTPDSLQLQKIFYSMKESKIEDCIMEVSSHSLDLNRVEYSDFNIGIFTNLSPEHLDFHKTIENYMNAKLKLFFMTNKCNIINYDDKYGKKMIDKIQNLDTDIITYGIYDGDVKAINIKQSVRGTKFCLDTKKDSIDIEMKTPGIFNIYNALAAASSAIAMGIDLDTIKQGLEAIDGVKGRFEVVSIGKPFDVIIDFAHSPDAFENVLKTVKEFAKGRIITVFGCGGDRDKKKRPLMGEIASKYSDLCILTSDNSRSEKTIDIISEIAEGVEKHSVEYMKVPNRREAINIALQKAKPKDIIMILGKGHETYQIIDGKTYPFDEAKIVKEYARKLD